MNLQKVRSICEAEKKPLSNVEILQAKKAARAAASDDDDDDEDMEEDESSNEEEEAEENGVETEGEVFWFRYRRPFFRNGDSLRNIWFT